MVFKLAKGVLRPWQGRHVRAALGRDFTHCCRDGSGGACKHAPYNSLGQNKLMLHFLHQLISLIIYVKVKQTFDNGHRVPTLAG
jgi:hypothetical protein